MKTIGLVVAVELRAVWEKFGPQLTELRDLPGYRIFALQREGYRLVIVSSGAGEIAAAAAAQLLISAFHAELVVNFGVVGGLTEAMTATKVCIVEKVVHYDFDTSQGDGAPVGRYLDQPDVFLPATASLVARAREIAPELLPVICASGDKFIADPRRKEALHRQFGAHICEMEAAGIVLTCTRCQVPCLLIKVVSDGIHGGFQEFVETAGQAAALCLEILGEILDQLS